MIYEFLLPNVDFGVADEYTEALPGKGMVVGQAIHRDTIRFLIQGRPWFLRQLVVHDGVPVPADVAYRAALTAGHRPGALAPSRFCCLQVAAENFPEKVAQEVASDICWLLQLPLGQKVSWVELSHRTDRDCKTVIQRAVQIADEPQKSQPIRNWSDGKLRQFLETAYPIYSEEPTWWRVTLDWFVFATDSHVIQVAGLTCSMLLERVPRFLLRKVAFPPQIDKDLPTKLRKGAPERDALMNEINEAFRKICPSWMDEKAGAILEMVLGWNAEPSYSAKNRKAFETLGMQAPSTKILENRHSLAHNGELKSNGLDPLEYYKQVHRIVIAVLLRALGYTGKFFALGIGEVDV